MEFNATPQYRPAHGAPYIFVQDPSRHPAQIMYSYATAPVQPTAAQPQHAHHLSRPSQPSGTWAVSRSDTTAVATPKNRASTGGIVWPSGQSVDAPAASSSQPASMSGQTCPKFDWRHASASADYYQAPNPDTDMPDFNPGLMGNDEDSPVIDLRQYGNMRQESNASNYLQNPTQRYSGASFSTSSSGFMPEVSTFDDFDETDTVSYTASDYDTWGNMEPAASNLLSPLTSPRRHDPVRTVSRGGGTSPGPPSHLVHNNVRSSPYSLESNRMKRWSTGIVPTSTPSTLSVHQAQDRFSSYGQRPNPHQSVQSLPAYTMSLHQPHPQYVLSSQSQPQPIQSSHAPVFSSPDQRYALQAPRPRGVYGLLQSNGHQHHGCSAHFADLSDPPNLYQSLQEEPCDPPESDTHPADLDMVPKEQDLRFEGDLYTPRWVRGHGNKREGWCGLCKPGRWLVLKNSAYWYDKSFTHGVSANTGAAFQGPQETRRTEGNLDVWEGLCGSCGDWVALVSSKKKGTTWFRHAYKCHTHPKAKDGPKRRRETSTQHSRNRPSTATAASSSSRPASRNHPPNNEGGGAMVIEQEPSPSLSGLSSAGAGAAIVEPDSAVDMSPPASDGSTPSPSRRPQPLYMYPTELVGLPPGSERPRPRPLQQQQLHLHQQRQQQAGGGGRPPVPPECGFPSGWAGMI